MVALFRVPSFGVGTSPRFPPVPPVVAPVLFGGFLEHDTFKCPTVDIIFNARVQSASKNLDLGGHVLNLGGQIF